MQEDSVCLRTGMLIRVRLTQYENDSLYNMFFFPALGSVVTKKLCMNQVVIFSPCNAVNLLTIFLTRKYQAINDTISIL